MRQYDDMQIGRATNRSTLGLLNNRVSDAKFYIAWNGGFEMSDFGELTRSLNETPMKPISYANGLERMRTAIERLMK